MISLQLFELRKLTDNYELILSLRLLFNFPAPSSSQGDQSKLGGPKKSLSERSPGVGREERPPIAVVVHNLKQVLSFISL